MGSWQGFGCSQAARLEQLDVVLARHRNPASLHVFVYLVYNTYKQPIDRFVPGRHFSTYPLSLTVSTVGAGWLKPCHSAPPRSERCRDS
jgi:hypothetical protein